MYNKKKNKSELNYSEFDNHNNNLYTFFFI